MTRIVLILKKRLLTFLMLNLFAVFVVVFTTPAYAVKYIGKKENGTYIFKCQGFCGDVRVIRLSKDTYRVLSIPFSGEVRASSPKSAAMYACKEGDVIIESLTKPGQSRNFPKC